MDSLTPERRSWNMSRIRGKDTRPEILVRSMLHRLGYRFRLNRKDVPGKPDIVLPKYRTAIYVHGCFWHRHANCSLAYTPKSNLDFWKKKFARNVERDAEVTAKLQAAGWKQITIWECELADVPAVETKFRQLLREDCTDSHRG
jgi:DNA mismatch endonuclease, patch repair protein